MTHTVEYSFDLFPMISLDVGLQKPNKVMLLIIFLSFPEVSISAFQVCFLFFCAFFPHGRISVATHECELASRPRSAVDVSPPKQTDASHCDLNPNDSLVVVAASLTTHSAGETNRGPSASLRSNKPLMINTPSVDALASISTRLSGVSITR